MDDQVSVGLGLCFVSAPAFAQSVGTYQCNDCLLSQPTPDPDTRNFITIVVNVDVKIWWNASTKTGKRVTICNLSECVVYKYMESGTFLAIASAPITQSGGGGGGGGSYTTIVGYRPITRIATVCAAGLCTSEVVVVGYEPIYDTVGTRIQ